MSKQRNDNSKQERANFYKVLVAIYYVLENEFDFTDLIIEHKGDVTFDDKIQIEVKHKSDNLIDTSYDFWNTLYNWFIDEDIDKYQKLILHTTQKIPKNSIFLRWKENINTIYFLLKQTYSKEINEPEKQTSFFCYKQIFDNYTEIEIKKVLSKIEIRASQLTFDLLIDKIGNYYRMSIPDNRDSFVRNKLGAFIYGEVANKKEWIISKKQFYDISVKLSNEFYQKPNLIIFDKYSTKDISSEDVKSYFDEKFVRELKTIDCDKENIDIAINDYWKTFKTIFEMDEFDKSFYKDEFIIFEKEFIHRRLRDEKDKIQIAENIETNKINSLFFYKNAKTLNFQSFKNIPQIPYLQHGTMHRIVQNDDNLNLGFKWLIEKK